MNKSKALKSQLESFGIKSSIEFSDEPTDRAQLSMENTRKSISYFGPEKAFRVIAGSKKFRQVVACVAEQGAISDVTVKIDPKTFKNTQQYLKKLYGVNMPAGTEFAILRMDYMPYVIDNELFEKAKHTDFDPSASKKGAVVLAKAPAAETFFLIGYDEAHLFISQLPTPVSSVEEAHKILIPKECVGKKYIRHGEFFLLPVPKKTMTTKWFSSFEDAYSNAPLGNQDGDDTDHIVGVQMISYSGEIVASGYIKSDRHKKIDLDGFYYVYMNNEVPSDQNLGYD